MKTIEVLSFRKDLVDGFIQGVEYVNDSAITLIDVGVDQIGRYRATFEDRDGDEGVTCLVLEPEQQAF